MFSSFLRIRHGVVLALGLLVPSLGFSRLTDDTPSPPKRLSPPAATAPGSTSSAPANLNRTVVNQQMQAGLDAALAQLNQRLDATSAVAPDAMMNLPVMVTEQAADDRSTARRLMTYLDQNPDRNKALAELRFEDLMVLPVGLRQTIGDGSVLTVGILKAEFLPTHAELTVFVRMQTTLDDPTSSQKERDLFFGVDKLRFTKEGGLFNGSFRAVLLGDYVLPMHSWTVILKGGLGIGNQDYAKTYVEVGCNSFQSAGLAAQIIFPRSVLVPFDEAKRQAVPAPARVGVDFAIRTTEGFRNILVGVNASQTFAVAGFERFGFKLQNLIVDLSDTQNGDMLFPPTYQGDRDERWRGLYLQEFNVLLPSEFQRTDGTKIDLAARSVLIDRSGFSGVVSYNKASNPEVCDASRWKLTLHSFDLEFVQNKPTRGQFAGGIETPITSAPFSYSAVIDPVTSLYAVSVRTEGDVPIRCWRANGKIYAGSQVELVVKDGRFLPSARLSGELTIGTNVSSSVRESDPVDTEDGTASFKGIQFTDLFLQTIPPYVSLGDFRYNDGGNNKLAGFPVAIVKLQKSAQTPDDKSLWIDFGFRVSLAEDRFAGASTLTIRSAYNESTGKLAFQGISIQDIYVRGTTTAVDLEGYVKVYETADVKGFKGSLKLALKKPFVVGVDANATFGYHKLERFRYGYVDIYASALSNVGEEKGSIVLFPSSPSVPGIPTGIADLYINGLGLGIYFNMKPQFVASGSSSAGCFMPTGGVFSYCPNRQIPFGFKAMAGVVNSTKSFQGRLSLEFALDRQYGINSIALAGNGVFGQQPVNPASTLGSGELMYYRTMLGQRVKGQRDDQLANQNNEHDQSGILARAKQLNVQRYGNEGGAAKEGDIAFAVGFLLNIPEKTLHAEAEIYVNKGRLQGIGQYGRAAKGVLHFQSGNTYLHLGYPSPVYQRMGIRYGDDVVMNAYLMAGEGVPKFPPPPPDVVSYFPSLSKQFANNSDASMSAISKGTAFALGANVNVRINMSGWVGYIDGRAIAGFDALITNGSDCKRNAWWGQGQVYGIVEASAGFNTVWGRLNLFSGTAGVYMYANAFNPTGFQGEVCVGITRRRKLCFDITIGDICRN